MHQDSKRPLTEEEMARRVAQDGTTVAANASRHKLVNEEALQRRIGELDEVIAADEQGRSPEKLRSWMAKHTDIPVWISRSCGRAGPCGVRYPRNRPCVAHSSEGCGLAADDAGLRPACPFLRVVAVMASAIVQKPLPKASQRARFNERLLRVNRGGCGVWNAVLQ